MTALRKLWELFEKYDKQHADVLAEYQSRQRLITDVIKEHDHADESRPE